MVRRSSLAVGLVLLAALSAVLSVPFRPASSSQVLTVASPFSRCGRDPSGQGLCLVLSETLRTGAGLASVPLNQPLLVTGFPLGVGVEADLSLERFSVVAEADGGDAEKAASVMLLHGKLSALEGRTLATAEAEGSYVFLSLSVHGSNGYAQIGNRTFILSTPWESQPHEQEKMSYEQVKIDEYVTALGEQAVALSSTNANVRASVVYEATGMNIQMPIFPNHGLDSLSAPSEVLSQYSEVVGTTADGRLRRVFRIASDVDYDMYRKKGSNYDATASFYSTLIGATHSIYARDFASGLSSVYMKIFTSPDGYPCCSSSQALDYMRRTWSTSTPSRSLAALVSAKNLGGGIAYVRVLCNTNYAYAINGNMVGYFPTPVQNYNGQNWDIYVFAHEVGHVFGASHTHELNPPVDYCGSTPGCSATRGTIMSYCHQCSGGLTNIQMAFHSRTKSEVTSFINYLTC